MNFWDITKRLRRRWSILADDPWSTLDSTAWAEPAELAVVQSCHNQR